MSEEKGKRIFSQDEIREIIGLIKLKEWADKVSQKSIRQKIRNKGLQWEELVGKGTLKLTLDNLKRIIEIGTIKVEGINIGMAPAKENVVTKETSKVENDDTTVSKYHSSQPIIAKGRKASDESYVIDLCDEILGFKALRQHHFDFLRGDAGTMLPVDAYYPELKMVVEYYESQHTQATPFFDNKQTVSGISRGEQRRIYDQRRKEVLPEHGIKLIIISYTDFGTSKHLKRNHAHDLRVIKDILMKSGCNF